MLANSDGQYVETDDTIALCDFLFERGMAADFNVFWNVAFDFAAIVKRWAIAQGPRLKVNHNLRVRTTKALALLEARIFVEGNNPTVAQRKERADAERTIAEIESVEHFDLGKYRVLYIPKKGFRLTRAKRQRGRNSVCFFDGMGWYATGISEAAGLDRAARAHLGAHKTADDEGLDVAAIGGPDGRAYYAAHRDAIVRYCIQDADLTARLFRKTIAGFEAIGFPFPRQPWSRASVGREILARTGALEATRLRYKELCASGWRRVWEQAYRGACIHVRGVGSWDDVADFDINSAYPFPMSEFPSLDGAFLVDRDDARFADAAFRFYEVDLPPTPRLALPERTPSGREVDHLQYFRGGPTRRACVTAHDLAALDAWGDPYTIVSAVGVVCPSLDRPLVMLREFYDGKSKVKERFGEDSVEYLNAKIPLNGMYGIIAQSRPREGRFTNFIYAAYITAWCRRALWLKALEVERAGGTVLAFKTDGLFVTGLPSLPPRSKALGAWDVKAVGTVTIWANGIYLSQGHLKVRGAPDLTPDHLRRCEAPAVEVTHSGPLGLKQGIIRGTPEAIGVWADETKALAPAEMLDAAGMDVPDDLRTAGLRDYFLRSWYLDYRRAPAVVNATPTQGANTRPILTVERKPAA